MIRRLTTFAAVLLLVAVAWAPQAQAQKIGYINQEAVLANMPEMQSVQQQLQQAAQQQEQQLRQEEQQLQERVERYRNQASLLSDSTRQVREQSLAQQQQQLQQSYAQREQQLMMRRNELLQPLLEELQTAIGDVVQRRDLDLVLRAQALVDVNPNSNNVVDITEEVATNLGIDLGDTETTPQPTVEDDPMSPGGN